MVTRQAEAEAQAASFFFPDMLDLDLYTCSSETDDDLVLLIYDQKIIGAWKDSTRGEDFFHTHKHKHTVRAIKSPKQGRSAAGARTFPLREAE